MSKTLEDLGYEKIQDDVIGTIYKNDKTELEIFFAKLTKELHISTYEDIMVSLTMEELKAIYKYYEDNKWI